MKQDPASSCRGYLCCTQAAGTAAVTAQAAKDTAAGAVEAGKQKAGEAAQATKETAAQVRLCLLAAWHVAPAAFGGPAQPVVPAGPYGPAWPSVPVEPASFAGPAEPALHGWNHCGVLNLRAMTLHATACSSSSSP
jgi:hypothetical protein